MRIVTGKYKGRHFEIPRTFKARPTTDFAKENLFNVLRGYTDIEGKDVLDLFAGTGSITAEFLSRGSHFVSSVELDREHCAFIASVLRTLGADNARLHRYDALRYITHSSDAYDIIFADPARYPRWCSLRPSSAPTDCSSWSTAKTMTSPPSRVSSITALTAA